MVPSSNGSRSSTGNLWAIVLAAGEGRRVSAQSRDSNGVPAPKQYCSFGRTRPMIRWALDRARRVVDPERVTTIVAREHERWWRRTLDEALPPWNVIVQPRNRGTALGVLLPTIEILRRDPRARIVILPSDHYVADEEALQAAVERALASIDEAPDRLVLVGVTPEAADAEYGWIVPGEPRGLARQVARFVEKPNREAAARLIDAGAVWNSFVVVATGRALLDLMGQTIPSVVESFLRDLIVAPRPGAVEQLYATAQSKDFSRDVLERTPAGRLALIVAPPCGWTDLGTPERLERFMEEPDPLVAHAAATGTHTHSLSS